MTFQAPPAARIHKDSPKRTLADLEAEMSAFGLQFQGQPIADGEIHRVPGPASKGKNDTAGWYVITLLNNDLVFANYGDWRTGAKHKWSSRESRNFTPQQKTAMKQHQAKVKTERERVQAEAAQKVWKIWEAALPSAPNHLYLAQKQIQPHGAKVAPDGRLIVPVHIDGKVYSLQYIDNTGGKLFHPGGKISGGSYLIPGTTDTAVVCEGFATAATIAEATGFSAYCAFNAGNLEKVVARVKDKHSTLVIAGDEDKWTDGNPGRKAAEVAARKHSCQVAIPTFSNETSKPTDFNDMAQIDGRDAVKTAIIKAVKTQLLPSPTPFSILSGPEFISGFVAPEYVVEGIIQRGSLYSLTARTGHGKTSICVDLTFAFAHGRNFAGQEVEQGTVCYLVGENPDDVRARFLVCEDAYNSKVTNAMDMIDRTFSIEERLPNIEARAEAAGGYIAVIVDTSAAYFQGDEENSNTQLLKHAQTLRRLTELPGKPAVIVPCHPVKNASKDNLLPRGGGAYIAEVDGGLTLWSYDDGKTTQLHHQGKLRGVGFEPLDFELVTRTSDKVKDKKDRLIPSVVAFPITEDKAIELSKEARSDEDALLDTMLNWPNGSYAQWCENLKWVSDTGAPQKSRIHRVMNRLKSDKLVNQYRKKYKLTEKGKKEAENAL